MMRGCIWNSANIVLTLRSLRNCFLALIWFSSSGVWNRFQKLLESEQFINWLHTVTDADQFSQLVTAAVIDTVQIQISFIHWLQLQLQLQFYPLVTVTVTVTVSRLVTLLFFLSMFGGAPKVSISMSVSPRLHIKVKITALKPYFWHKYLRFDLSI